MRLSFPGRAAPVYHPESDAVGVLLSRGAAKAAVLDFLCPVSRACLGGRGLPYFDCKCHRPGKGSATQRPSRAELFWRDSARSRHAKSGEELPRKMRTSHEKL